MLDEEILLKYKTEIDDSIAKLIKEYGLTTESEIAELTAKYKQNFIKGFHQGIEIGEALGIEKGREEGKLKMHETARNLLHFGLSLEVISESTGLSEPEIKKLPHS